MNKKVELGDEVEDRVSGFKGIAVARTRWISGCDRISIQPKGVDKDGKTFESQSFDEPMLKIIKRGKVEVTERDEDDDSGGPRPNVSNKK